MIKGACIALLSCSLLSAAPADGTGQVESVETLERKLDNGNESSRRQTAQELLQHWKRQLNRIYDPVMARRLPPLPEKKRQSDDDLEFTRAEARQALLASQQETQRAWQAFKEADMEFLKLFQTHQGPASPENETTLLLREAALTMQRLQAVEQIARHSQAGHVVTGSSDPADKTYSPARHKLIIGTIPDYDGQDAGDPVLNKLNSWAGSLDYPEIKGAATVLAGFRESKLEQYARALLGILQTMEGADEKTSKAFEQAQKAWHNYTKAAMNEICPHSLYWNSGLNLDMAPLMEWLAKQRCNDIMVYLGAAPAPRANGFRGSLPAADSLDTTDSE